MGAYLLAPHATQLLSSTAFRCSAQCGHTWTGAAHRFCSVCGASGEPEPQKNSHRPLFPHQVASGRYEDDFYVPETGIGKTKTLWVPNKRGFGELIEDADADNMPSLTFEQMAPLKEKLLQTYTELFMATRQEFSVALQVHLGPVAYWS